ncbi:hypothetical protein [Acidovorax sp. sic0104]|uniref:hypothetical protein n=1 Tax=Acidovorax sp. sic0104 TaxID=2854784 RepID=UPI001C44AD64|nr:hypothetical protein [Acidovorax sp. sic0104]MBV7542015.1 hypothetical protein [Acidovorax sp. sic0104]
MQDSETHTLGRNAALRGYSVQAPSHLRSIKDLRDYEDGWLAGKRQRQALLEGKPTVRVAHRTAHPTVRALDSLTWVVRWHDQGSGADYTTPELAQAGLEERVARDADLAQFLAKHKPRH